MDDLLEWRELFHVGGREDFKGGGHGFLEAGTFPLHGKGLQVKGLFYYFTRINPDPGVFIGKEPVLQGLY